MSQETNLPLFFSKPAPLTYEKHGKTGVVKDTHFKFAAKCNAIPLNVDEFFPASRYYPIVFAQGEAAFPIALLGMRDGQNLFVDKEGQWRRGCYVPAYVRRYPFLFMSAADSDKLILGLDEGSDLFTTKKGSKPLYEAGKPGAILQDALNFCTEYQRRHQVTTSFMQDLVERDLLLERAAQITMANGDSMNLTGFSIIDQEKLDDLPNKLFLDWRRKGWLPLIYAHQISLQSWSNLVDVAAEKDQGEEEA